MNCTCEHYALGYEKCPLCEAAPELLEACKLVDGIVKTLLDEAGGKKATDWGIVNDGLVTIAKAIKKAEGREEGAK